MDGSAGSSEVVVAGGVDRRYRVCRCRVCGVEKTCTPRDDFFQKTGEPETAGLLCEACFDTAVGIRPLSAADLLLGIANVPLRILEQLWIEEVDRGPDAMWISLSNGRDFTLRLVPGSGGIVEAFERDHFCDDKDTGLSREVLAALGLEVWARYAEQMQEVEA